MSESVVTLTRLSHKVMGVEAAREAAITAIALKRYQLTHGDFPADLTALVPEFVSAIPRDPVDGQPLRYRRNADGTFLLYSVGENGKDDGGDPRPSDSNSRYLYWQFGRDWVWPQPATPEEIQNYYVHPPQ